MNLNPKEEAVLGMIEKGISYENYFFKKATNVKWFYPLKKKGYFSPEKAPGIKPAEKEGYYVPQWNVLPYLERISQQVNVQGNEKYIDELLIIISEVSKYQESKKQDIDNYHTWRYFVKILLNIPNNKIPIEIIELIPIWLNSKFDAMLPGSQIAIKLLPKFLTGDPNDIKKAEKIIGYITLVKTLPTSIEKKKDLEKDKKIKLAIDFYILKEVFEKYSEDIGKKCSEKVIEDLIIKIKKIIQSEKQGTYSSFHEKLKFLDEPLDMLTFILKNILDAKAKSNKNTTLEILKKLFGIKKYLYFPKMALFIIGNNLDKYEEYFWKVLNEDIENSVFKNSSPFGDELKYVLMNLKKIDIEKIKILQGKIENSAKLDDFRENKELYLNIYKQKFYKALSRDQYFKGAYEKTKSLTGYESELRPTIGKVEISSGFGPSPLTKEKILQITNKELADFLFTFKPTNYWEGPSVLGLSNTLKEVVKEKPEKFIDDLNPFLETGYIYVYDIIWGIRDSWESKRMFDWGELFEFIKKYISTEDFWNDKFIIKDDEWKANHFWILGIVGDLIKKGTIKEDQFFSEEYFQKVQEIIFQIIDKMLLDKKEVLKSQSERNDYLTYALNSTFGKISEALFMLAYRIKKCEQKAKNKQPVSWEINIKNKYKELFDNEIIESYIWFGRYLAIFYLLLDKKWTEQQINQISYKKDQIWEAFMQGYLQSNNINGDLYRLMRSHYEKAIEYKFKEEHSSERSVQHICLLYLQDIEKIEDENGLFRKIINKWNPFRIKEIIGWLWMQRDSIMKPINEKNKPEEMVRKEKMRELINDFWRWVYENKFKEKEQLNKEDKEILSKLSKLAVFIQKINCENYEWLKLTARYINVDFNTSFFLKYLDNLKDKDKDAGRYVGKIFLKILKNSTPDYDEKDIRSIVEYLYISNFKEFADEICNIYSTRGLEFLRDIYEKYKKINS